MTFTTAYLVLGVLWVAASVAGGAVLALLAKRAYPGLSMRRLWVFYSALLAFAVGAFFAVAVL